MLNIRSQKGKVYCYGGVHALAPHIMLKGDLMEVLLKILTLICKLFTFQWVFLGLIISLAAPKILEEPFLFVSVKMGRYFLISGYIALFSFLTIGILNIITGMY